MYVIQLVCGRIGMVTGQGIAENLRRHYPRWALQTAVLLLLIANVINLGADLGAMGAAVKLLIGGPELAYTVALGVISVALQVLIPYSRYAAVLKWLTLSLFAYVGVVFAAHVDWPVMLRQLVWPHIVLDQAHGVALVAVLGTTISPYLFFWQAGQEVEEGRTHHARPLRFEPKTAGKALAALRLDTGVGMFVSNLIAVFHHHRDGGHIARARSDQDRDERAGGGGVAADRWPLCLPAVRRRDHRHGAARGARARGIGGVRGRGDGGVAVQPGAATTRGEGVLRRDRDRYAGGTGAQFRRRRSDQGLVLRGCRQRRAFRATDGTDPADRRQSARDGEAFGAMANAGRGVAGDGDHGGGDGRIRAGLNAHGNRAR